MYSGPGSGAQVAPLQDGSSLVEQQVALQLGGLGRMTFEAPRGQDRPDVAIEVGPIPTLGGCGSDRAGDQNHPSHELTLTTSRQWPA